jgi:hypothetical protein
LLYALELALNTRNLFISIAPFLMTAEQKVESIRVQLFQSADQFVSLSDEYRIFENGYDLPCGNGLTVSRKYMCDKTVRARTQTRLVGW